MTTPDCERAGRRPRSRPCFSNDRCSVGILLLPDNSPAQPASFPFTEHAKASRPEGLCERSFEKRDRALPR